MTRYAARPSIEDLKTAAESRVFDVLGALGINEKPRGNTIVMCDPTGDDKNPSFAIWLKGGFLTWKRFGSQHQGDILGLVAYVKGWDHLPKKGIPEVCRFLEGLLGFGSIDRDKLKADLAKARQRQADARKAERQQAEKNAHAAFELFLKGEPVMGSLGEKYLRQARGIDLQKLPLGPRGGGRVPSILRFIPNHPHKESGRNLPCLMAACTDPISGEIRAVHRTWLRADGSDKADVKPQRKVWPAFAGLVMPVWRGDSGWSVGEAAKQGYRETLVLTEGIEDALSAAIAAPKFRTWAMISLSNMQNVVLPECIDSVLVHRQSEWTNGQACEAFDVGRAALEAQGRDVAEIKAFHGKDLNDTLRGVA